METELVEENTRFMVRLRDERRIEEWGLVSGNWSRAAV